MIDPSKITTQVLNPDDDTLYDVVDAGDIDITTREVKKEKDNLANQIQTIQEDETISDDEVNSQVQVLTDLYKDLDYEDGVNEQKINDQKAKKDLPKITSELTTKKSKHAFEDLKNNWDDYGFFFEKDGDYIQVTHTPTIEKLKRNQDRELQKLKAQFDAKEISLKEYNDQK